MKNLEEKPSFFSEEAGNILLKNLEANEEKKTIQSLSSQRGNRFELFGERRGTEIKRAAL